MGENTNTGTHNTPVPSLPPGAADAYAWWTFARWNTFLWFGLLVFGLFYGVLHMNWFAHRMGFGGEYTRLSKEQLAQVAAIYAADGDSAGNTPDYPSQVRRFINSDFNQAVDKNDLDSVIGYLHQCTNEQATMFLTNKRLKVHSYFWLSGSELYWEVIFWSVAGVLTSLIFMLSSRHRKSVQYSDTDGPNEPYCPEEVPYQIGKLFYAPLCTMVLIFGYNYIQGDNRPDIFSSKGMLALSFLCGFFSGRVMTFINRIKEAIIPATNTPVESNTGEDNGGGGGGNSDTGAAGNNAGNGGTNDNNTTDTANTNPPAGTQRSDSDSAGNAARDATGDEGDDEEEPASKSPSPQPAGATGAGN